MGCIQKDRHAFTKIPDAKERKLKQIECAHKCEFAKAR